MAYPRIVIAPNDDPRWGRARSGDLAARNSLVEEHIRLLDQVVAVVCAKLPTYADRDDIRSFGSFGLIRAVETYNPDIASFRTHAVFLIKARIYDELRSMDWAPKGVRKKIRDVDNARKQLESSGSGISDECLADFMGVSVDYVQGVAFEKQYAAVGSLDEALAASQVSAADPQDAGAVSDYLWAFRGWVDTLSEVEQAVWTLRFYCKMTTNQAAAELGVSPSSVSQVSSKIFQSFHEFVDSSLVL